MSAPPQPNKSESIAYPDGKPTPAYIKFFARFTSALQGQIDQISAALASILALETTTGGLAASKADKVTQITGSGSLIGGGDLSSDKAISLENDADSPGNDKVYGTNSSGVRGWQAAVTAGSIITASITNGDTTHAPSGDAVFDALAGKVATTITVNGYPLSANVTLSASDVGATTAAAVAASYQPLDTQLTSLAGLTYGSNALKVVRIKADESGFELATISVSTPTGTGFTHITAGVEDAAAKLVDTADISADAVTYAKMQNASANTVIARAANSSGDLSEVALSASQLLGRGSTGDVAAITLGAGLSMTGTTLAATGGVGGVGMTLIGTATVSGSAATTLTLGSLDLSSYKQFYVILSIKNAVASAATPSIYYNSDTTATNYRRQSLTSVSSTITAAQGNAANPFGLASSSYMEGVFTIQRDQQGYARMMGKTSESNGTALRQREMLTLYEVNANITGITISSDIANSLAVGSFFHVFGVS